jgi:hypothetical protein
VGYSPLLDTQITTIGTVANLNPSILDNCPRTHG